MAKVKFTKKSVSSSASASGNARKRIKPTQSKKPRHTNSQKSVHQASILNYTGTKENINNGQEKKKANLKNPSHVENSTQKVTTESSTGSTNESNTDSDSNDKRSLSNHGKKLTKAKKRKLTKNVETSPAESVLRKKTFFDKQVQSWKPLSKETLDFVEKVVDNGIREILNRNLKLDYDDVRTRLDRIRNRLISKVKRLEGPRNKYGDYRKLLYCKKRLQTERSKYEEQEEILDEAIDVAEREQTLLEQENKKMDRILDQAPEIHPLLQMEYESQLELPDMY